MQIHSEMGRSRGRGKLTEHRRGLERYFRRERSPADPVRAGGRAGGGAAHVGRARDDEPVSGAAVGRVTGPHHGGHGQVAVARQRETPGPIACCL